MTILRNVGELASPYFLLELWARREEIGLEPDVYAALKRKARALVRDGRAFEARGEPPDEEWRARRRELLDLTEVKDRPVILEDGLEFLLLAWRDSVGGECLLVGDLLGFEDPDQRPPDAADPPSTRFELALRAYHGDADWGLLLAGLELRIYRRSSGISQQYLAIDIDGLVEVDDEAHWRAFAALFRAPAFAPCEDGIPFVQRVVDESRRHATALAEDMRADVIAAAEALLQGALDHPDNLALIGSPPSRQVLRRLFEETLYYLYRILFVLYAEARDVFPLSGGGPYATTYSVDHLVELARRENESADSQGSYYTDTLRRLFRLLWNGSPEAAKFLGIEPVGGELFDPARTKLLDQVAIGDPAWARALTALAVGAQGSSRRKLGRRSSFAELGVDQLGSIYEGLLVLEPHVAPGLRVLVRDGMDRRVVEPGREGRLRLERHLEAGTVVLESASGRRKGSGSFYTPPEITEYLTHAALDPLLEPILARAAAGPARAERDILAIRVCDPAMGSGAFLVQAARILGVALARARAARRDGRVTPDMIQHAKRDIVRRCLYGVDLNPLAVALAKVSLWLETLEKGKPLSFLDSHLRCGDSLVGVDFPTTNGMPPASDVLDWPKDAPKGLATYLRKDGGPFADVLLTRLRGRKGPSTPAEAVLPGVEGLRIREALARLAEERAALVERAENGALAFQLTFEAAATHRAMEEAAASIRNRLREAANFWCAQCFSEGEDGPRDATGPVAPPGWADFEEIVACLLEGRAVPERLRPYLEAARQIHERRHFFHWSLEFPEVMLERGGFDVVIGNPPWNTLSPDVKEFFSTYDAETFRKGVPKAVQHARLAELRRDPDIDFAWRTEARFLYELSTYAKPESGRFTWYARDPQLRKGDANVFRLFVERAYKLLRDGGRLAQVLPEAFYVSSPATGLRQRLLSEGQLERCYVFENREEIFPIHRSVKVVLLVAQRGGGPTDRFRAAFFVGKDAAGGDRTVGLEDLPRVLADLDREAPELAVEQIRALTPQTWSFPELQTALDAEIAAHCVAGHPPLNLDERGWGLKYCAELHADRDAGRFKTADYVETLGTRKVGLRYVEPDGTEWWPLVEGHLFYHLEFLAEGKEPRYWVRGPDVATIEARRNPDGSSVMEHYRVAWRDVASATNERSAIAAVLPPRTAAKHTSLTIWGGLLSIPKVLALASLFSSFCFDYLVRFMGKTHLTYAAVNSIPAPPHRALEHLVPLTAEVVCQNQEFDQLWGTICAERPRPSLVSWELAERRAQLDAEVAAAYGLSLGQYAAVLCTFPNLDRTQPMLPGEPKCFVTRDFALFAYCKRMGLDSPDIVKLLGDIKVVLSEPKPEYRRIDARVARYREIGAIPYRPTPRGGRTPTDPELVQAVRQLLGPDPQSAAEVAEALGEDEETVEAVLKQLLVEGEAFADGRGKHRRYYVIEEEES